VNVEERNWDEVSSRVVSKAEVLPKAEGLTSRSLGAKEYTIPDRVRIRDSMEIFKVGSGIE
jgi:hypothetical protein